MNCGNLGEGCGRRDFLGDTNTPGPNDLKIGHLGKFALSVHFLTKLCILPSIRVLIISRVKNVKMSYCDVTFDDVTKCGIRIF